jgi:hypothetical protein
MTASPKIVRACMNPPGKDSRDDYNAEWVELQIGAEVDLSGYSVEHFIHPETKRQEWSPYYRFGDEQPFPAGSVIRIYSGAGTARREGGTFHRYVADDEEKGQWCLNNDGDTVRVLTPEDNKLDEKAFTGKEGYCTEEGDRGSSRQKKPQTQYA